jgi:hypothetical protein
MRIKGEKINSVNIEIIVIPRPSKRVERTLDSGEKVVEEVSNDIVFKARAVLDFDNFTKLCPAPEPPSIVRPGGMKYPDPTDLKYLEAIERHNKLRFDWIVIQSLKETEGLEWETVKDNMPETWANYSKELRESGFSSIEVSRIVAGALAANSLDEDRLKEARENFLRTQVQPLPK